VPRRELSEAEVRAIVRREATERRDAAAGYDTHGRDDAAARLRHEATVLDRLLADADGPDGGSDDAP
jgi:uncharacterized protein YqeY